MYRYCLFILQATTALVAAIRTAGKPVAMAEVAQIANVTPKDIGKHIKLLGNVPPEQTDSIFSYMVL